MAKSDLPLPGPSDFCRGTYRRSDGRRCTKGFLFDFDYPPGFIRGWFLALERRGWTPEAISGESMTMINDTLDGQTLSELFAEAMEDALA